MLVCKQTLFEGNVYAVNWPVALNHHRGIGVRFQATTDIEGRERNGRPGPWAVVRDSCLEIVLERKIPSWQYDQR